MFPYKRKQNDKTIKDIQGHLKAFKDIQRHSKAIKGTQGRSKAFKHGDETTCTTGGLMAFAQSG